jgi:hypothetical protein
MVLMTKQRRISLRAGLVLAAVALITAGAAIAWADGDDDVPAFKTTADPQLVPLAGGVKLDPILTAGDVVGGELGGYQMSAIPDGIGLYRSSKSTVEVFMNHELGGVAPNSPPGVGARVTHATLDDERRVLRAEYVFDGTEGFLRFCSSNLAIIDGVPWYFTGEESVSRGSLTPNPNDGLGRGGAAIAMNGLTGRWYEARHWGLFEWEQPLYVGSAERFMILGFEDGPGNQSQLYAYSAPTLADAIAGNGQLSVWAPDEPTDDDNPSTNDIQDEGDMLAGHFEPISTSEWNPVAFAHPRLELVSQLKGAFDFGRLEDGARSKTDENTVFFADTGGGGTETMKGRLYRLDLDPSDPTKASLTLLVDGDDRVDEMINPDNLDTSAKSVVISENRGLAHATPDVAGGFSRILVYEIKSGEIRTVARTNSPNAATPGDWESSGIVNAFDSYGRHWWLVDVQTPGIVGVPQPGPSLEVNSSVGQSGQLLAIRIPDS